MRVRSAAMVAEVGGIWYFDISLYRIPCHLRNTTGIPYSEYAVLRTYVWPPSIALWAGVLGAPAPVYHGGAIRRIYKYLSRLSMVKW
jgi:hypothetical protein